MSPMPPVPRLRSTVAQETEVAKNDDNRKSPIGKRSDMTDASSILPRKKFSSTGLLITRSIYLSAIYLCFAKSDIIQSYIDASWDYLRQQWWFQTVYFETLLVVVFSFPSTLFFQIIDKIPYFDRFRIEPKGGRLVSDSIPTLLYHSTEYILPLAFLDTFHVKHYHGVTDDIIANKRQDWIQRRRALPDVAPRFGDIVLHIFVAIVIYDALFFTIHYNLHKNKTLYRIFHKKHHTHKVINAKVTDQQHWMERVAFILCANAGLKVQGAHPLTRMLFVFVFISLLLYSHGGYDFPWALDKVVPFRICSGAREHYEHHEKGKRYYQFIFTHLDKGLDWWTTYQKQYEVSGQ